MKKFLVKINERLSRTVVIEAEDKFDAECAVNSLYNEGGIVLNYDDFVEHTTEGEEIINQDYSCYENVTEKAKKTV